MARSRIVVIDNDREAVRRIVALLFALAGLADRAAGRSFAVRSAVLAFLRPAETPVRNWILLTADGTDAPMPRLAPPSSGVVQILLALLAAVVTGRVDSPDDARLLAQRFRALASMLDGLPAQAHRFARRSAAMQFAQSCAPRMPAQDAGYRAVVPVEARTFPGLVRLTPALCDTS